MIKKSTKIPKPESSFEMLQKVYGAQWSLSRRSLRHFARFAWPIIEPGVTYQPNFHIDAICEHLEAVKTRQIQNLIINIPPGCMKSILVNVMFQSWCWIDSPEMRFMNASYMQDLSTRDSLRTRQIIESEWYKEAPWGDGFRLTSDQNAKTYFTNSAGGWRMSSSVGGRGTGEHPDFFVIDDPHKVKQAESQKERQSGIDWFSGTVSTRGVARDVGKIVIMQRLHDEDLSGYIYKMIEESGSGGEDWEIICLPMRYEPDRQPRTCLGFVDPRSTATSTDALLLWPGLFTNKKVTALEIALGSRAAGQLQQRPPEHYEGAEWPTEYFSEDTWFDEWPDDSEIALRIMALDPSKGATEKSDYSAFVMLKLGTNGIMYVDADLERMDVFKIAKRAFELGVEFNPDGFGIETNFFQGTLSAMVRDESKKAGMMFPIHEISNHQNKIERIRGTLSPYLGRCEIKFRRGSRGAAMLVSQLKAFPGGVNDDGPDALEMAVRLTRQLWSSSVSGSSEMERLVV